MARIAIAEPSTALRQLLAQVVTDLGHEPVHLAGGERRCEIDLLLVEPDWPQARRLAECFRRHQPGLPIACISNRSTSPWAEALGIAGYLVKPFSLRELEALIGASLAGSAPG
jgi:DNA-binding response OmpR family regulator